MKQLTGSRGWEYAYKKGLEERVAGLHLEQEKCEGRTLEQFAYLCGQIRGIRDAIRDLAEVRERFHTENDGDQDDVWEN
jgi:hypothetical protein